MVKQRTDFGSNDSGAVLCIPCLVQMWYLIKYITFSFSIHKNQII